MELHGTFIPLLLFCTTLLKILQAQRVDTDGEVIGYQNYDVTLSCHYIHRNKEDNLDQVQWTWQNHSDKHDPTLIIINHQKHAVTVPNTFLKERGEVTYADVTILRQDKVNRNTLLTGDVDYAAVFFSGHSGMTSQQGSANPLACRAHTEEHASVYAAVKKDH
ncbi:hypothetical protein E1301_Tti023831 [Triplophysa tibetana]|uniref:Uncharacterized protein n=1 Tax=Triplophysa tibetana TaxID=1572043 RepID=A0A5A9MWY5_9TELE|nr:hypothetical protein E1301_Tti023831 [Triplophysa tibetana]